MTDAAGARSAGMTVCLAFIAGYVEAVGFVGLFGVLTAYLTGNLVLIGSEVAQSVHGVLLKLSVMPAFVCAVALARWVVLTSERKGRRGAPLLLMLQAALLLGFMLFGSLSVPLHDASAPVTLLAGIFGGAAMGVQTAATKIFWPTLTPTTAMTGNITQLVIDLVDVAGSKTPSDSVRAQMLHIVPAVVSFAAGAVAGPLLFIHVSFAALWLPVAITLGLAALMSRLTSHLVSDR